MAFTLFGSASSPADNGSANEPTTLTITPPGSMTSGMLVLVYVFYRATSASAVSVSNAGGQSWTQLEGGGGDTGSNSMNSSLHWCEFDGTWDASPAFAVGALSGTVPCTAVMLVFQGATGWSVDVASSKVAMSAALSPTITAQDPVASGTLSVAAWMVSAANTWGSISGSGWAVAGDAQYRNTAGSDISGSFAYIYVADGTAPADVTQTQSASTAGIKLIVTFTGTPASGAAEFALSKTLGTLTSSAAATVEITASLSKTLGTLTSSAASTVDITASLSATLGTLTSSAVVEATTPGDCALSQTLGALTSSASATVDITAAASNTLGSLTGTAAATVNIDALLSKTLDSLTASAVAETLQSADFSLSATLGSLTSTAAATVNIDALLAQTLAALTASATATVAITASLSQTLGALTASSQATGEASFALSATLDDLTSSGRIFKWDRETDENDPSWAAQSGSSSTWTAQSGTAATWTPQTSSGTWTEQSGSSATWTEQ